MKEKVAEKTLVEVKTRDFIEVKFRCISCGTEHAKDAQMINGQCGVRCKKCGQIFIRDEKGQYSTSKNIIRDGRGFREIPDSNFQPVIVSVTEKIRTERWAWKCPSCNSSNEAGYGLEVQGPVNGFKDSEYYIHEGLFLKCWSCLRLIKRDKETGNWTIYDEGER